MPEKPLGSFYKSILSLRLFGCHLFEQINSINDVMVGTSTKKQAEVSGQQ